MPCYNSKADRNLSHEEGLAQARQDAEDEHVEAYISSTLDNCGSVGELIDEDIEPVLIDVLTYATRSYVMDVESLKTLGNMIYDKLVKDAENEN